VSPRPAWLAAATWLLAAAVQASGVESAAWTEPRDWQVIAFRCPAGCSEPLRRFLQATVGQRVRIEAAGLRAGFIDGCDGQVEWARARRPAAQVAAELDAAAPPGRKVGARTLQGAGAKVWTAVALCRAPPGEALPMARLIQPKPGVLLWVQEEQAVLELR
jgi:hypothetical protein